MLGEVQEEEHEYYWKNSAREQCASYRSKLAKEANGPSGA